MLQKQGRSKRGWIIQQYSCVKVKDVSDLLVPGQRQGQEEDALLLHLWHPQESLRRGTQGAKPNLSSLFFPVVGGPLISSANRSSANIGLWNG